jgi:3-oxoacyl-[acyl-carrier protein] reductase
VINTNLRGAFLFTRAVTRPMMQQRYGRIVNIASVSGLMGNPGQSNYSASKAGMIGMTRSVSRELASRKVTVNAIAPGFIETEMTAALGDSILEEVQTRIPVKRLGKPEEIVGAVLYLCSTWASYLTGQVLTVDGGLTA